jgi:hypothetical protein
MHVSANNRDELSVADGFIWCRKEQDPILHEGCTGRADLSSLVYGHGKDTCQETAAQLRKFCDRVSYIHVRITSKSTSTS